MKQQNHGSRFIQALGIYASLVKFELTEEIMFFYTHALRPHDLNKAADALIGLAKGAKVGRGLPSVNEIIEQINPQAMAKQPTPEEDGALAAELIAGCLVKFGSMDNRDGWKTQRDYIGELGWAVVELAGGWYHLCCTVTDDSLGMLKSQWRKEAQAMAARARAGLSPLPQLPPAPQDIPKALGPAYVLLDQGIRSLDPKSLDREMEMAKKKQVEDFKDPW